MQRLLVMTALACGLAGGSVAQDTGRDKASVEAVGNLEAYAAYKMGQYDRAREMWLALAGNGNTTAMLNLANLYEQGQGVPRDQALALGWTRKAAERGDPRAQMELGQAYEDGAGVPRDNAEAARWFRAAAEQGDGDAAFNLGVMLATNYGQGVGTASPEQRKEAADWLAKAAQAGNREAPPMLEVLKAAGS